MNYVEYLQNHVEKLDVIIILSLGLSAIFLAVIIYLLYLVNNQRKENAIKRDILRKKIGCSAEDFYSDVI